jgi:putative membrane protein
MSETFTDRQLGWIVVAILVVLLIVPAFGMGFGMMGYGPMMGGGWEHGMWDAGTGPPTWVLIVGGVLQLGFLAVLLAAGYLAYRRLGSGAGTTDPAIEELRTAYARGELTDEEFERRRERLEREE